MSAMAPRLSVIVPAHDSATTLWRCLHAVAASELPRSQWELIVVDDGSDDDTAVIAAHYADLVIRLPGPAHGPDYARNRGVEVSRGRLLLFVSADVCIRPDTMTRFLAALEPGDIGAVSGSYAYAGTEHGLAAYQAMYNRFIRERAAGDADAVFAGFAAVRSDALSRAGGFDEWSRDRPRVAARELGHRIRAVGYRVLLGADVEATHLRGRSLSEMLLHTLRDHGVPYDAYEAPSAEASNAGLRWVRRRERASPLLCWSALGSVAFALRGGPEALWWLAAASLLGVVALNAPFLAFVIRHRGLASLLWVAPLHFAGATLVGVARLADAIRRWIIGEPRPAPVIEAFVEVGHQTWPPVPVRRTPTGSGVVRG